MSIRRYASWLLCLVLVSTGCTGRAADQDHPEEGREVSAPAAAQFRAPDRWPSSSGAGPVDDYWLSAMAARDELVVAVGGTVDEGRSVPLVVVSPDAGHTWERGTLAVPASSSGQSFHAVAGSDRGFVAFGDGEDGRPSLWASADGHEWERVETSPAVFTGRDGVEEVRAYDGRFYAIGRSGLRTGRALATPVLWTSDDGRTWRRTSLLDGPAAGVVGTPNVEDVVARGQDVIVLGGVEDNSVREQPNRIVVWRSGDGGRSFRRDRMTTPSGVPLAGDYREYVSDVTVVGDQIYALCMGDGADRTGNTSWDGVVLRGSFDGGRWRRVAAPAALGAQREDVPATIDRVGDSWVVSVGEQGTAGDARVATGRALGALTSRRLPGTSGEGDHHASDALPVRDAVLMIGGTRRSGTSRARIWRVPWDASPEGLRLPSISSKPRAQVIDVATRGRRAVAVGSVGARAAVWTRDDWEHWRAQGLDVGAGASSSYAVTVQAVAGGWLAAGLVNRGKGTKLAVWRSQGGSFKRVATFDPGSDYASVVAQQFLRRGSRLVLLTTLTHDGFEDVQPLYSTDQGRTWQAGYGDGATIAQAEPAVRPVGAALRGPVNGSVGMPDGAITPLGFLAVGSTSSGDRGHAQVWLSTDGRRWQQPARLPQVPGAWSTAAHAVAASGREIVVVGSFRTRPRQQTPGWVTWTSSDRGRSWRVGEPPTRADARAGRPVRVGTGWLVTGSRGPDGDSDAAAWWSEDGRHWVLRDLDRPRGAGDGVQWIGHGDIAGDRIRLIGADFDASRGAPAYAVSVELDRLMP